MTNPVNDNLGDTPDHGASAVVSLTDARAQKSLDDAMLEIVRELARQAAIAHHNAALNVRD